MSTEDNKLQSTWLFPVRTVICTKAVKSSVDAARRAVQDPPTLIHLNPWVTSCSPHPKNSGLWIIVDKLRFLGLPVTMKYTALFTLTEDGVEVEVRAGLLTRLKNKWRVRIGASGTEIVEEVQAQAFFLFMPFVENSIKKSHDDLLHGLTKRLEDDVSQSQASSP